MGRLMDVRSLICQNNEYELSVICPVVVSCLVLLSEQTLRASSVSQVRKWARGRFVSWTNGSFVSNLCNIFVCLCLSPMLGLCCIAAVVDWMSIYHCEIDQSYPSLLASSNLMVNLTLIAMFQRLTY